MKIYFDSTQINPDYIITLSQSCKLFNNQFRLGATLCREIHLDVLKSAVGTQPSAVYIKDDSNNTLFTLFVDTCDDTDLDYYSYTLLDGMVKFNTSYDYSVIGVTATVQNVLNAMCQQILGTTAPTVEYMGDLIINWNNDFTARDFISYVAEVNGCFARINTNNQLEFIQFKRSPIADVDVATCADIEIGEHFKFDRVVYDPGVAASKYPSDEDYTGNGNTYYVNTDNFLFTDDEVYTRDVITQHIFNKINNFEFYNLKTSLCELPNVQAGDLVTFELTNTSYTTIAQFEWTYNVGWYGGFELEVQSQQQEETQIISPAKAVKSIQIKVDRQIGEISQRVTDTEGDVTQLVQDATSITGTFANYKGVKYITANIDGITISSSDESSPTELNLDNDGVFINDAQGHEVAAMEADTFRTSEWLMTQTKDNTVFNIFRRRS